MKAADVLRLEDYPTLDYPRLGQPFLKLFWDKEMRLFPDKS